MYRGGKVMDRDEYAARAAGTRNIFPPLLRGILRVLGSEERQQLVSVMVEGLLRGKRDYSLVELAEILGRDKSTVHYHLSQLSSVGLVRQRLSSMERKTVKYALTPFAIRFINSLLEAFLESPRGVAAPRRHSIYPDVVSTKELQRIAPELPALV